MDDGNSTPPPDGGTGEDANDGGAPSTRDAGPKPAEDGGGLDGDDDAGAGDGEPDGGLVPAPLLTLDHVQMRGTHNSYHLKPPFVFHASHDYSHLPLDRQLDEQGVRVLELDLHRANTDDTIDVYHIKSPVPIDDRTTCLNFEECLRTVRGWSDAHPAHVPVIVWVELKDDTGGPKFENLDRIEYDLRTELGERLLTPDDIQGDASSLHEAIVTRGWPTIDSVRGKFLFVILSQDSDIDMYTEGYTTTAGRLLFPRVHRDRFESPVAAFAKLDVGDVEGVQAAHAAKLMVATNVCSIDQNDQVCEGNRVQAISLGFHMLKDDLPAPVSGRNYFMALPDGMPVACNPVRAPAGCTAQALEAL